MNKNKDIINFEEKYLGIKLMWYQKILLKLISKRIDLYYGRIK